jgi:diguanylate cyclase (GGDEF)-like protein
MDIERIVLLLLESDALEARFVREMLGRAEGVRFSLRWSVTLADGLALLRKGGIDLVMMELALPDSWGMDTFLAVHAVHPDLPVVIYTGMEDAALAIQAVQQGAQYQLIKGSLRADLLARSLRYAVERNRLMMELRSLTLNDDLTGLYNRRGFTTLARQQLKVAARNRTRTLLFYLDLDGLKEINDRYGHAEGDVALLETANILKSTFRDSDIIARIGGDEFAVMLPESSGENAGNLRRRLSEQVRRRNAMTRASFRLSVSSGYAECAPGEAPCSLEDLLRRADALMYEEKRAKRPRPLSPGRRPGG